MKPEVMEMMNKMARATTINYCLTPEEAARSADHMMPQRSGCKTTRADYANGVAAVDATCENHGQSMTIHMRGTYTPTSYTTDSTMESTRGMNMVTHGEGAPDQRRSAPASRCRR